jgi:hypothetical protein
MHYHVFQDVYGRWSWQLIDPRKGLAAYSAASFCRPEDCVRALSTDAGVGTAVVIYRDIGPVLKRLH